MYLFLKMAEFFCKTAVAHRLEDVYHLPIFGIKKLINYGSLVKMKSKLAGH